MKKIIQISVFFLICIGLMATPAMAVTAVPSNDVVGIAKLSDGRAVVWGEKKEIEMVEEKNKSIPDARGSYNNNAKNVATKSSGGYYYQIVDPAAAKYVKVGNPYRIIFSFGFINSYEKCYPHNTGTHLFELKDKGWAVPNPADNGHDLYLIATDKLPAGLNIP